MGNILSILSAFAHSNQYRFPQYRNEIYYFVNKTGVCYDLLDMKRALSEAITITQESFESLKGYYEDASLNLDWNLIFTLPQWLEVWWRNFGTNSELHITSVRQNGELLGIAPLQIKDGTASIIGSVNVCDYQDFITITGKEEAFFNAILDDLEANNVQTLHLESIRPDSKIMQFLKPLAEARKLGITTEQSDISLDLDLPLVWEDYLNLLDRKQRHEIRRKIRNIQETGTPRFYIIDDTTFMPAAMERFLALFPESRRDKAKFMTPEMQKFFMGLASPLAEINILRFGVLDIDSNTVAMVMFFEFNNNIYMYNSAYDPQYKSASVRAISKANNIQYGIIKKKNKFDFLKGSEKYKYHMSGKEIPLFRCLISLSK